MVDHENSKTIFYHCVFIKRFCNEDFIILLFYVDDILIIGYDARKIERLKREFSKFFDMKDLGPAKQFLEMRITHSRKNRNLWLSQKIYIKKLERFNMNKSKLVCSLLIGQFKLSLTNVLQVRKIKK